MKNPFKKLLGPALVVMAALVTGCPSNDYVVDLAPHGDGIGRTLTFFRQDGTTTNGDINYVAFPADALTAIERVYPAGSVTHEGDRYTARGEFAGTMPGDIGGVGYYSNFPTSLGSASFYTERFRGADDLSTNVEARLRAADKLVDHVLGWSRAELGGEPRYQDLRRFLDTDFRHDLKNLRLYWWLGTMRENDEARGGDEFAARFGQYLVERGYLRTGDLPGVLAGLNANNGDQIVRIMQRFIAGKLGVPESRPAPKALAFLSDTKAAQASWEEYLSTTPEYGRLLEHWRREKLHVTWFSPSYVVHKAGLAKGPPTNAPAPPKPPPSAVVDPIGADLLPIDLFGTTDLVTVHLALPSPPTHTNGKWDAAEKKLTWERTIEQDDRHPPLPAFFFATWAEPDESFQKAHFGSVLLTGDDLTTYCLWYASLNPAQLREWKTLLDGFRPGDDLAARVGAFHFSGEPVAQGTNAQVALPSDYLRTVFAKAKGANAAK